MNDAVSAIDVCRERIGEFGLVQEQETINWRQDRRHGSAGRRIGDQRRNGLAFVGCKCRDVNDGFYLLIRTGFTDDDAAIGVTDKNDRAILLGNRALGDGDIIGQRGGRILDDADVVTVLFQNVIDTLPAGTIDETTVDKDDVLCTGRCSVNGI